MQQQALLLRHQVCRADQIEASVTSAAYARAADNDDSVQTSCISEEFNICRQDRTSIVLKRHLQRGSGNPKAYNQAPLTSVLQGENQDSGDAIGYAQASGSNGVNQVANMLAKGFISSQLAEGGNGPQWLLCLLLHMAEQGQANRQLNSCTVTRQNTALEVMHARLPYTLGAH
jgi:hypothetical protein